MRKNLKVSYLKKLRDIKTRNGYEISLGQYIYGVSHGDQYPQLKKLIEETKETRRYSEIYYFKHYDGSGAYYHRIYTVPNNEDLINISRTLFDEEIEEGNRFSLNHLVTLAENITAENITLKEA